MTSKLLNWLLCYISLTGQSIDWKSSINFKNVKINLIEPWWLVSYTIIRSCFFGHPVHLFLIWTKESSTKVWEVLGFRNFFLGHSMSSQAPMDGISQILLKFCIQFGIWKKISEPEDERSETSEAGDMAPESFR